MVRPIEAQRLDPRKTALLLSRPLFGLRVLIVEDDYYLAMEAKTVLEDAGAEIIGPLSNLEQFQQALTNERPDCAVMDINLGGGLNFAAAQRLEAAGVPFLFHTGYSLKAIPPQFQHVTHKQKPAKPEALVQAVRRLSR